MQTPASPLPVTVISGYFGAGKTTLVNHLLRHPGGRRLMVLVNDFGELAIDADLIAADEGNILTLANGCVCCSMGGNFDNALVDELEMEERPDHLVTEASGVAKPARIANIARAESDLLLDGVVTVIDAENFDRHLADHLIADSVMDQIAAADLLLVNKADRTPAHDHEHEDGYRRWSHESSGLFDRDRLKEALAAFPDAVLRVKGVVFVSDRPKPVAVHRVGRRVTLADLPASSAPGGTCRLVAIGHRSGFDAALLTALIEDSLVA